MFNRCSNLVGPVELRGVMWRIGWCRIFLSERLMVRSQLSNQRLFTPLDNARRQYLPVSSTARCVCVLAGFHTKTTLLFQVTTTQGCLVSLAIGPSSEPRNTEICDMKWWNWTVHGRKEARKKIPYVSNKSLKLNILWWRRGKKWSTHWFSDLKVIMLGIKSVKFFVWLEETDEKPAVWTFLCGTTATSCCNGAEGGGGDIF